MRQEKADVLIVGAGGAALRAAIAAYDTDHSLRVMVATKGQLGQSGVTATACSDRMAFHATLPTTEPGGDQAWRYHADDIYRIGGHVSDGDLAEVLAQHAAEAFADLDRWGVPFARRSDGTVDQFVTDGSAYARACYTGPYTANHIEAALVNQIKQLPIEVMENAMVAELLPSADGQGVAGALIVDEQSDGLTLVQAKAVVLATGGAGQAFAVNVYPPGMSGDGLAMAYRLGAELVNLEFIQIGLSSILTKLACSGSMMRALPRVVNSDGDEFLAAYFPPGTPTGEMYSVLFAKGASWPISWREPSHVIDIAVAYERSKGRQVYLDYASNPTGYDPTALSAPVRQWYSQTKGLDLDSAAAATPLSRLMTINPPIVQWLAERGINLEAGEPVEIAPAIQHFQGGVKIRRQGNTTIAGLYAAGETAGGQHGANRPGGNALLDSQVFGKIAGAEAAAYARGLGDWLSIKPHMEEKTRTWLNSMAGADLPPAATVRTACQSLMDRIAGVLRVPAQLEEGLETLEAMEATGFSAGQDGLAYAVETANILLVSQLIANAALRRRESRGPHLMFAHYGDREPLARDDTRWQQYIVLRQGDGGIQVELEAPRSMSDRPAKE